MRVLVSVAGIVLMTILAYYRSWSKRLDKPTAKAVPAASPALRSHDDARSRSPGLFFTRGRRMAGSTRIEVPSQHGRLAIVTGATGGLGYETALALAKAGADVIVAGRDARKGQAAIEKIRNEAPHAQASFEHLDLANLASIAAFSERALSRQSLDILINNAGVMALPRRTSTADGFEAQFGTNIWVILLSRSGYCRYCTEQAHHGSSA